MKKKLLCISLVVMMLVTMITPALASIPETNCVERQTERLHKLRDILLAPSANFARMVPFCDDGEPIYIPNINLIVPPSAAMDYFFIGLEFDYLGYDDFDITNCEQLIEISLREPPQGAVDFILSFTGISEEQAVIGYSFIRFGDQLPSAPPPDVCPVWGDVPQCVSRSTLPIRMGEWNFLGSLNGTQCTVGHPLNAAGTRYFTTFHRSGIVGSNVYLRNVSTRIGTVSRATFNMANGVDITEVNLTVSGRTVSSALPGPFPAGSTIGNFRGTPRVNDVVRSIRGRSGLQQNTINNLNASFIGQIPGGTITVNHVMLTTLGSIQNGDSGAALIRVSDRAVMGTLGGDVTINGVRQAWYSNVQRY